MKHIRQKKGDGLCFVCCLAMLEDSDVDSILKEWKAKFGIRYEDTTKHHRIHWTQMMKEFRPNLRIPTVILSYPMNLTENMLKSRGIIAIMKRVKYRYRLHAVVFSNRMIYDPSLKEPVKLKEFLNTIEEWKVAYIVKYYGLKYYTKGSGSRVPSNR
jgi:hypothetical protein